MGVPARVMVRGMNSSGDLSNGSASKSDGVGDELQRGSQQWV